MSVTTHDPGDCRVRCKQEPEDYKEMRRVEWVCVQAMYSDQHDQDAILAIMAPFFLPTFFPHARPIAHLTCSPPSPPL